MFKSLSRTLRCVASVAFAATLSACGGGGGTSTFTPPAATPTPVPSPPDLNQHPLIPNAVYNFKGVDSATLYVPGQPPQYTSDTVANTQTILANQTYNGVSNLYDFNENVAAVNGDATQQQRFDNYEGFVPAGAGKVNLVFYGDTVYKSLTNGNETLNQSSTYATPNILDELPHVTGAVWHLSPKATFTSDDVFSSDTNPSEEKIRTVIDGDGSYTKTLNESYAGGSYVETFTMNPDATGEQTVVYGSDAYPSVQTIVGAPIAQGNASVIPVQKYQGDGTAAPALVSTFNMPLWYPNGNPNPLYTGTIRENGTVTLPSQCKVGASVPTTADDLQTDIQYVETWGDGYLGSTVTTSQQHEYIAAGVGLVCETAAFHIIAYSLTAPGGIQLVSDATTALYVDSYTLPQAQKASRRTSAAASASYVPYGVGAIARMTQQRVHDAFARDLARVLKNHGYPQPLLVRRK